jgi:methionyl-tRNA formyltransferase
MIQVLSSFASYPHVPQPEEGVTHAAKVRKEEARIDWSQDAGQIERQVRAFAPSPGAWFEANGERIKVLEAEIGDGGGTPGEVLDESLTIAGGNGALHPKRVQRAGRAPMSPQDLLRGFALPPGTILR